MDIPHADRYRAQTQIRARAPNRPQHHARRPSRHPAAPHATQHAAVNWQYVLALLAGITLLVAFVTLT